MMRKRTIYLLFLIAENEITEYSQQVGRLYGKVWKRYTAGRWVILVLGTKFRSEKIPQNRLGMISVIPQKKLLILRHSEFCGRAHSEVRNGRERNRAGIFKQSMGARYREGKGLSYRPTRLHRLAEFIPWNRFLFPRLHKRLKIRAPNSLCFAHGTFRYF